MFLLGFSYNCFEVNIEISWSGGLTPTAERKYTRKNRNGPKYWNGPVSFLFPADFLVILMQYTCTDSFQVIPMIYIYSL